MIDAESDSMSKSFGGKWYRVAIRLAVAGVLVVASALITRQIDDQESPDSLQVAPSAVDIGFCQDMSIHHQQAVTLAQLALLQGDGHVKSLAYGILLNQANEIGRMQEALELWGAPPLPQQPMSWMSHSVGMDMDQSAMPGMATAADIAQMQTLTGNKLDIMFLQLMIRHHQGGIEMARSAAAIAKLPQIKAVALRMLLDQTQEMEAMLRLLAQDGATPLHYP